MARQFIVGRTYSQIPGVLFSLLLAFPTLCLAQAGAIVATAGDNSVVRAQAVITPLKPGTAVQQGDSIVTAPAGRLQVRFADGAFLSMQPNTRFQIDEHRFSNNEERSFLSLLRGAIRMASGLIGKTKNEDFKLNTPSATIGIRGTHFVVEHTVCDPLCSPGTSPGTRIAVTEGRVIVSNDIGTIELGQNESALIENHSSLPQLIQWRPQLTPRSIELPAGPPGPPGQHSAPAAPGRTELNNPATSSPTDQPIDSRTPFSRWVDDPPRVARDRQRAENPVGSPRLGFELDRPLPLPNPAESARRDANGQFPELATLAPNDPDTDDSDHRGDNTGDNGSNNGSGSNSGNDNGNSGGDDSDRNDSGEEPIDDIASPTPPPSNPGPSSGPTDASGWLISLQPIPGTIHNGLIARDNLLTFDDNLGLQSIGHCDTGICLSRGSAKLAEAGHDDYAAWGRWTNGNMDVVVFGLRTAVALSANEGMHYITGAPALSLPASGAFTYNLTAATAPTMSHDWYTPGSFSGRAAVQFAPGVAPRVGLSGQVDLAGDQFQFSTAGGAENPAASQLSLSNNQQFSGLVTATSSGTNLPWMCGSHGCSTQIRGALFGPSGERLGLSYTIRSESASTTIDGVSIFSRP